MKRAASSAALVSAAGAYLTPWCCSKRVFRPLRISIVSAIDGSGTSTFWKRRDSAWSFSKICRYSLYVVAPMHFSAPVDSAGFSRFDASSVPPDAAPAPMIVWISSMNRIDFGIVGQLLQHRLQPLLEIAAVLGAGEQRAHVERIDLVVLQQLGHVALVDAAREALGDRGLADAGLADQQRIVLAPAAQHLDDALELVLAADQRIDLAGLGQRD